MFSSTSLGEKPLFPIKYYYFFSGIFCVLILAWVVFSVVTIILSWLSYIGSQTLPIPTSLEIFVMLLITLFAALKLRRVAAIEITETGLVQSGTYIAYHQIKNIEYYNKWLFQVIIFRCAQDPKKAIFLICPHLIENIGECIATISEKSHQHIRL